MKKTAIVVLVLSILVCLSACSKDASTYKEAQEAFTAGDYSGTLALLDTIPDYKDSESLRSHATAIIEFTAAAQSVENKNAELDAAVNSAQEMINSGRIPLDESTPTALQLAVSAARESKREVPYMPVEVAHIIAATEELTAPLDYAKQIQAVEEAQKNMEDSIKQLEQVTNPTGDFVILRLGDIDSIVEIGGVTEDNDPNGKLNKQGGYTSATYFSVSHVNQDSVYGDTVIDKGTSAGGCIEVYATAADAEARNTYLAAFDGGMLSSGSHHVIGTVVIRTSDSLTATQQNELTEQIKTLLIELR